MAADQLGNIHVGWKAIKYQFVFAIFDLECFGQPAVQIEQLEFAFEAKRFVKTHGHLIGSWVR